ncbi:sugar transferase [Fredinandcohnia quinoae]|uniref:Sugar transferase n=1 Tax=Fredinandcohnia quinoae TaxID=2918902 RepID=A0AAW5E5K6_9BACI|nr:sugar transferase [Fredinandcohnia sp. SECRCQ15]MCH1624895.1 sugar transferase [Fredinandcohnia sp. SECRCQ15]
MGNIGYERNTNHIIELKGIYELSKAKHFYNNVIKRGFDLISALILLVLLLPLMIIISILVKADSPGPIFYRGNRAGRYSSEFYIFKFRTMVEHAEKLGGGTTALNDSRITKTGAFLRKSKLDEIPQLLNIIKGDMSFIGPRPELTKYTSNYQGDEQMILAVRPGITDISSMEFISLDEIVGPYNADEAYEKLVLKRKNLLRIKYVQTQSILLDLKLFFFTCFSVLGKIISLVFKIKREKRHGIY